MSLPASLPHIPVLLNKKTLNIAVMYCNKALNVLPRIPPATLPHDKVAMVG